MIRLTVTALAATALMAPGASLAAKPPKNDNQVSLGATPVRVLFGRTTVLAGKVTGADHAGKTVTLQEDGYPFDGFKASKTTTTAAGGDYSFSVIPALNTRYQVVAKTTPDVQSGVVFVQVVPRVSLAVSDGSIKQGTVVRFTGTVAPAHNGGTVLLQRRASSGSWSTIKTLTLAAAGTSRSSYSTSMRVKSTTVYRTVFKADADHGTGKSKPRTVTVS